MAREKIQVSRFLQCVCCSHSRSLLTLSISHSLCLCLEASAACANSQQHCVRTFHNFDIHVRGARGCQNFAHRNLCQNGFLCLSCHLSCPCRIVFPLPFPGEDVDFHRIIVVSVHACCSLEDASVPQVIFRCHTQSVKFPSLPTFN